MYKFTPSRINLFGNSKVAQQYIGVAKSQMEILVNSMKFQNLKQAIRRIKINDNVYIECRKVFDLQMINIYSPEVEVIEVIETEILPTEFYIRFKFNGYNPVNGGEKVRIQFPDDPALDYSQLFRLPLDTVDELNLVGPFIFDADHSLGLSLDCEFRLGDNKYTNQYSFFHNYFEEVSSDDPDRTHYSYVEIIENTCETGPCNQLVAVFREGTSHVKATNFWKKNRWYKSKVDLSNAPTADETINGEVFPVYTIDWDVYGIQWDTTVYNGYSSSGEDCSIEDFTIPGTSITTSTLGTTFPEELVDHGYQETCFNAIGLGEYVNCKQWESYIGLDTYDEMTANNLCIRINEENNTLSFSASSKQSKMDASYVKVQRYYNSPIDGWEWVEDICSQEPGYSGPHIKVEYFGLMLLTEDYF